MPVSSRSAWLAAKPGQVRPRRSRKPARARRHRPAEASPGWKEGQPAFPGRPDSPRHHPRPQHRRSTALPAPSRSPRSPGACGWDRFDFGAHEATGGDPASSEAACRPCRTRRPVLQRGRPGRRHPCAGTPRPGRHRWRQGSNSPPANESRVVAAAKRLRSTRSRHPASDLPAK